MQLVGYFREIEPGVHFDAEIVERIAAYSLAIDCDFYKSPLNRLRGATLRTDG
jgi:hypothetical protein